MFRPLFNNKIGNTLIFLATNASPLSLTKALKMLYLIDETAVKETGVPFTWLDYKVWKFGPVTTQIYFEIRNGYKECVDGKIISLNDYIKKVEGTPIDDSPTFTLEAIKSFEEDEFTDYELDLLKKITHKYGKWTAKQLVDFTHREGSLWEKIVQKYNLNEIIDLMGNTDFPIDFLELIKDDEMKQQAFVSAYESLMFQLGLGESNTFRIGA